MYHAMFRFSSSFQKQKKNKKNIKLIKKHTFNIYSLESDLLMSGILLNIFVSNETFLLPCPNPFRKYREVCELEQTTELKNRAFQSRPHIFVVMCLKNDPMFEFSFTFIVPLHFAKNDSACFDLLV